MADMVVITSPRIITNPIGDHILYADSDIILNVRPEDAGVADGAPVNSLRARGFGRLEELTFGASTGWGMPTLDADGANGLPCLNFDGTQQIANVSAANFFSTERVQPLTYFVVAKTNTFTGNSAARFIGGSGSSGNIRSANIYPSTGGSAQVIYNAGAGATTYTLDEGTDWAVHFMVADGANGKIKTGHNPIVNANVGDHGNRGLHIGANITTGGTGGLDGAVAEVGMLGRALTDAEIMRWYDMLGAKYSL